MKTTRTLLTSALLAASTQAFSEGTSPWLPIPGQLSATVNYTEQSGDSVFIQGETEVPALLITGNTADEIERTNTTLTISYGLSDGLAIDAVVGYGEVDAGRDSEAGIIDTLLGLSWQITDEYMNLALPTITVRVGAIIGGDYEGVRLASLGNASDGADLSLLVGKSFSSWFALSAGVGVLEYFDGDVPTAYYYELTSHFTPLPGWYFSLGYSENKDDSDLDFLDSAGGYGHGDVLKVRTERKLLKASVGYGFGNHGLALLYNDLIDGRNTLNDSGLTLSYTYAF